MPRGIPRSAKNSPVIPTGEVRTEDQEIGQGKARLMKSTGPAEKALEPNVIEPVQEMPPTEKMLTMAFMNEPVTIRVATTTDKQAEQVFDLNINGHREFFKRGEDKTVARNFVERLALMKQSSIEQREVVSADGIRQMLHVPVTALKYDFGVVRDANPRGREWLEHVLRQPG